MKGIQDIQREALGQHFGKSDLDRVGYFHDPSPAPFGKYQGPAKFREGIDKGRQILNGTPGGLFEKKFERIFEGEALSEPWRVKKRLEKEKRKIVGRLVPPSSSKKHSTPGDWHGCFDKPSYFSPALKEAAKKKKVERELPNVKIKPNPLGGPGYANICFSPFPSYSHEPYEHAKKKRGKSTRCTISCLVECRICLQVSPRFLTASAPMDRFPPNPYEDKDPGPTYVRPQERTAKFVSADRFYVPFPKRPGGNHDGCFNKFPEYTGGPDIKVSRKSGTATAKWIAGGPALRTKYTNSVVEQVTRISCNANNYSKYRERVYPLRN